MTNAKRALRILADIALVAGPTLLRDAAGLAGVAAVSFGCWSIYRPAGYIAGGLLLIAGAVLSARDA